MPDSALLTESEVRAIRAVLTDAARRIDDSRRVDDSDDQPYEGLLHELHAIARAFLDSVRAQSSGRLLLPELLSYIFSFLPFPELVAITAVCRSWRDIIRGDPRLWARIATRSGLSNTALPIFLERGKNVPIALDIRLEDPQPALGELITPHFWRMRQVVVSSRLAGNALLLFGFDTHNGFARPAPCLRRFELRMGWGADNIAFDSTFFAGQAPVLEELWLDVECQPVLGAFPNLRTVVLTHLEEQSFQFAWGILYSCPLLEHVAIGVSRARDDVLPASSQLPLLRFLKTLRFHFDEDFGEPTMEEATLLLSVLRPDVRARTDVTLRPVVAPHDLPAGAESILILNTPSGFAHRLFCNIHLRGSAARRFLGASLDHTRAFVHEHLVVSARTLLALTLPAHLLSFISAPGHVNLERLREYTVLLHQRHVVFDAHGAQLLLDRMPALQTFALTRARGANTISQDVLVDSAAVLNCFAVRRAGLARIPRMVLCGVETRLQSADVRDYVDELAREPWEPIDGPRFDRMDQWLFIQPCP